MEEITDETVDISKLEPNKFYYAKNSISPYVPTDEVYAMYTFDPNENIDLNDFSIIKKKQWLFIYDSFAKDAIYNDTDEIVNSKY